MSLALSSSQTSGVLNIYEDARLFGNHNRLTVSGHPMEFKNIGQDTNETSQNEVGNPWVLAHF